MEIRTRAQYEAMLVSQPPHSPERLKWDKKCGQRLRAARLAGGLSINEASFCASITKGMWLNRERGEVWLCPDKDTLRLPALAHAVDTTPEHLLGTD